MYHENLLTGDVIVAEAELSLKQLRPLPILVPRKSLRFREGVDLV